MTRVLLKKQLQEIFSFLFLDRKSGKSRSVRGMLGFAALYVFLFASLGVMFWGMAEFLCEPMVQMGLGWFYMMCMALIALVFGVIGSVFSTYTTLYGARDNDLLLSMPIPIRSILVARLCGVYLLGLLYELIVMVPAIGVWLSFVTPSLPVIVFSVLIPLVLSFFILALSCLLGWVVALVASRVRRKNLVSMVLSIAFVCAYMYGYSQAYELLGALLQNAQTVANGVKNVLFPLYHMGLAAQGSASSMLIFSGIMIAPALLVYLLLSRSFLLLATTNKGSARRVYKERTMRAASVDQTLLKKELGRLFSSVNYTLNCGLGVIFMPIAAILLFVMKGKLLQAIEMLSGSVAGIGELIPLLLTASICMLVSMVDITAPCVSLEGKNVWILQVLPVTPWQVLRAKLRLQLIFSIPCALLVCVCALIVLTPSLGFWLLVPLVVVLFSVAMAQLGLVMNLLFPNLKWTNEIIPIKQSASVAITLFGGWVAVLVLGVLYYALHTLLSPAVYLVLVLALLAALVVYMQHWLKTRGARRFAAL